MKILYLMHVDWDWIKQRPHFIAEKMSEKGIDIKIYYSKYYHKNQLAKNDKGNLSINCIPKLPFSRNKIIRKINDYLYKLFINSLLKNNQFDYVYITDPTLYLENIKIPVIYDCMDDVLAFDPHSKNNNIIFYKERSLVNNSKYVFFTSENLKNTVLQRYNLFDSSKFIINNNAIELPKNIKNIEKVNLKENNKIKLIYIGTITKWFDFELLKKLDSYKYEFHLFGPVNDIEKGLPDNFIFHGIIQRDKIFSIMNAADILIMPFCLNELIKSVNPVKLYEYIYSCKPIITVKYGESEKFSDYVYLYQNGDVDSFSLCIEEILMHNMQPKNSYNNCKLFVENNTWDKRTDEILDVLFKYNQDN